jgi:hypothetical protein
VGEKRHLPINNLVFSLCLRLSLNSVGEITKQSTLVHAVKTKGGEFDALSVRRPTNRQDSLFDSPSLRIPFFSSFGAVLVSRRLALLSLLTCQMFLVCFPRPILYLFPSLCWIPQTILR